MQIVMFVTCLQCTVGPNLKIGTASHNLSGQSSLNTSLLHISSSNLYVSFLHQYLVQFALS